MLLKNFLFSILKALVVFISLFLVLKLITFLPVDKFHPLIADSFVKLQRLERSIETRFLDFGAAYRSVAFQRDLERNYESLYRELEAKQTLNKAAELDNQVLRAGLKFAGQYPAKLTPVEIISRSADNWFSFVVVNKGSADGIKENMAVIDPQGLVGHVFDVARHSARVILITDPQVQVSCLNLRTKEISLLCGRLLRPLELKYATVHSDIQAGDLLVTSGYSYRYKKGIPVGRVRSVSLPKNKLFQKVEVEPLVDLNKIDILFILR